MYLLIYVRYGEKESYHYNNLFEMLSDWECGSVKEILRKNTGIFHSVHIYKVQKEWHSSCLKKEV